MNFNSIEVVAPNFKKRWSGVTSTIFRLLPIQEKLITIVTVGPSIPASLPQVSFIELLRLSSVKPRVWHARRNLEMLGGLILKKLFRKNLKLVFTSAAQRKHSSYTKKLISRMDAVIATSQKSANYLQVPHTIIHHGIDTEIFKPASNKISLRSELDLPKGKLVGCFGRVRPQKGVDIFIEAMIRVCAQDPMAVGIVCGQTTSDHIEFEANLKAQVTGAGLSDRIIFLGTQPSDKLPLLFAALDIYVAPQRNEGFGLTPLEAMASGVPVIATTAGAFEEMVLNGETGYIVEVEDTKDLTERLVELLSNERKRKAFTKASIERVAQYFDIKGEAATLVTLYKNLLSKA